LRPSPVRSIEDRNALVLANRAIALEVAKRYFGIGLLLGFDPDDVTQDAYLGLIYAAQDWNPHRKVKGKKKAAPFDAYARFKLRNSICDGLRRGERTEDSLPDWVEVLDSGQFGVALKANHDATVKVAATTVNGRLVWQPTKRKARKSPPREVHARS